MSSVMPASTHDASLFPAGFAGFWDSLRKGKISFPKCEDCGEVHWYPMTRCPHCYSERLGWQAVSGEGTLYSWTTVLRTMSADKPAPYTVGLVEFAELPGVRLVTNVIDADPETLQFGMKVAPVFVIEPDAMPLVHFRPAARSTHRG
jgi:uncharacterized OB-fold protein